MCKKIGIIFVVLVVVGVSLPCAMGFLAKHKLDQFMSMASNTWGIDVKLNEYKRGWFHSAAQYAVTLSPDAIVNVQQNFTHGPVIFVRDATAYKGVHFAQALVKTVSDIPNTSLESMGVKLDQPIIATGEFIIRFSGAIDGQVVSPQIALKNASEDFMLQLNELKADVNIARKFVDIQKKVTIGNLMVKSGNVATNFNNITVDNNYNFNKEYQLWVGKTNLNFPMITVSGYGKSDVVVNDLKAGIEASLTKNLANNLYTLEVGKIVLSDVSHGPGSLRLAFNHLDAKTFAELVQLARSNSRAKATKNIDEQQNLRTDMLKLLPALLSRGAQIELKPIMLTTQEGELNFQATLALPEQQSEQGAPQLQQLLSNAKASIALVMPKPLLSRIMQQQESGESSADTNSVPVQTRIDAWVKAQILNDENNQYSISIAYNDGQTTINGHNLQELPWLQNKQNAEQSASAGQNATASTQTIN